MKITTVGCGYVGLCTGTIFAEQGHKVFCIDIDQEKIKKLKKAIIPIYEPGLEKLVKKNIKAKRLFFDTDLKKAVKDSEIIFIAVGTPSLPDGRADLSYVKKAAEEIGKSLNGYKIIINKSTVPIGTGDLVSQIIKKYYKGDFEVVSNPEFLREGTAVFDCQNPDRIVIGCESKKAKEILEKLYKPFQCPIVFTNLKTAEMIKYASNSFLASSISFINSIARICEKVGADVNKVAEGMKLDKRIGKRAFLGAGIGYGGSCFSKDVKALIQIAKDNFTDFQILEKVEEINKAQKKSLISKLNSILPRLLNKKIAIWGLSFKPDTDDLREAPSINIVSELLKQGVKISAYDPVAGFKFKKIFPQISLKKEPYETLKGAEALLILTEWDEFKKIDKNKLKKLLKKPNILDGRNIYNKEEMEKLGLNYISIGREMLEPKVSIVIKDLKILSKLKGLDYRNYEVLVLGEKQRISNEKVKFIHGGNDEALSESNGEILTFLEKETIPERDWLKKATRHFKDPNVGAVGGPAISFKNSNLWERVSACVFESFLGSGGAQLRYLPKGEIKEVEELPSVNLLFKKECFQKVGGFDENLLSGFDTKFCQDLRLKLKKKVIYDPEIKVFNKRGSSLEEHLKKVATYAFHRGFFAKKYKAENIPFKFSYALPSLFFLFLLSTIGLWISRLFQNLTSHPVTLYINGGKILGASVSSFFTPSLLSIFSVILGIYIMSLLFWGLWTSFSEKNIKVGFLSSFAIFLTHFTYGFKFLHGLLSSKLR